MRKINGYINLFGVIIMATGAVGAAAAFTAVDPTSPLAGHLVYQTNAAVAATITLPFLYTFNVDGTLEEAGSMGESSSPYWWVNSGGMLNIKDGIGFTNQGNLPLHTKWQTLYYKSNPTDTADGQHPQNIFRLLLRTKWTDISEQATFKINQYNPSASINRAESNGILLMTRYLDGNNLYYTGLRVDGYAVIKKKKGGVYYTMAYKPVLTYSKYNRTTNPNLLPLDTSIVLKNEIKNLTNGQVSIKLYADIGNTGTWTLVAEAVDDGKSLGGSAITSPGYVGIRTDFMDVEFDDFKLSN